MKKRGLKKVLSMALALTLSVGLCACGEGDAGGKKGNANAALAKQNVYKLNEFDVPELIEEEKGYSNVWAGRMGEDGRVYVLFQIENWQDGTTSIQVMSMEQDGSDMKITEMEQPVEEKPEVEEGTGDTQTPEEGGAIQPRVSMTEAEALAWAAGPEALMKLASSAVASEAAEPAETTESAETEAAETTAGAETSDTAEPAAEVDPGFAVMPDEDVILPEDFENVWEYSGYGNFAMAGDGTVYGIRNYYYENYAKPEASVERNYICCWNADGSLRWMTQVEGIGNQGESGEWISVSHVLPMEDGGLTVLLMGENVYRMPVSSDGTVGERKGLPAEYADMFMNSRFILPQGGDKLKMMYNDVDDWSKCYLVDYDMTTDTMGEPASVPSSLTWGGYGTMTTGLNADLIYANGSGIFTYNLGDEQGTERMNYINSDVNITDLRTLIELDDKRFIAFFTENYENDLRGALFTYVAPEEIPDKTVLVLAGSYVDSNLKQRVIEYNRANEENRIVIKEYEYLNSYEDYEAGYTQLNNEIITGGMPDILLTAGLPVENYISKGLIADVSKLIEKDEELSQEEFMQNVFDAYSVDGKLYYVIPRFEIVTMIAKASLVGDGSDWSVEKMKQVLDSMGEDAQAIGEVTRDNFMSQAMQFCGMDFIDVSTGKCSFDSEDFISMMEFAKTLPEEIDWDKLYENEDYWMSYESQYRNNKTLLMRMYVGDFSNLTYQLNGYFGEEVTYVGFPTQTGNGAYISATDTLMLSAKSKNLDAAWEFVRYYLTDEYQDELQWGLSVHRDKFLEKSKEALKRPTYIDYETQQEVEYDETFWINGESIVLDPLNQAQLDKLISHIESVNTAYYYNEDVLNIINEEMGAFYSGQKTAKDTAAIIQSRVQLFVDENR